MFDLDLGRAAGASCKRSGNAALDKRKIFRMGKGLFVRGVRQNCLAQGNRFQSCIKEETQDVYKGLLEQRILSA